MAGVKRSHDGMEIASRPSPQSPFISVFESYRSELDQHHDRREKIIKASRDITAQSKKMSVFHPPNYFILSLLTHLLVYLHYKGKQKSKTTHDTDGTALGQGLGCSLII